MIHTFDKRPALIKYYPDKYKLISAKSWVIDDVTNRLDRSKPYYIKYNTLKFFPFYIKDA